MNLKNKKEQNPVGQDERSSRITAAILYLQKIFLSGCSPRKWVKSLLLVFFMLFALWGLLIFWLDPYICFHKAFLVKQTYSDSYATIPGMLRHFSCDAVLIGSSMCRNFRISEINRALGVSALKATAAGMTGDDAGRILQLLITEKRPGIRRIILGYDIWSYSKGDRNGRWRSRRYLYDQKISWEYFFSMDSLEAALNVIVTNCASSNTKGANLEKDFDRMFSDKLWRFVFSREVMENSIRMKGPYPAAVQEDTFSLTRKLVLQPLGACPEIKADIFLPPYSIYFWTLLSTQGELEGYLKIRQMLVEYAERYPNIRIHDFQSIPEIICDLDNYKDMNHYSPEVNRVILNGIRDEKYVSSRDSMKKANMRIRKTVREWDQRYRNLISGRTGTAKEK